MSGGVLEVMHPWELSREQWNTERERLRPCFAQSNLTKSSGSEATARHNRLMWLLGGVRDVVKDELRRAQRGELKLSSAIRQIRLK
jgi:hypothetical protein